MKNANDSFIVGRLRSLKFAFNGIKILITTEDSIKVQLFFTLVAIVLGFCFHISSTEWLIQFLITALVLVAETVNTAIEKIADFIHPEYHKKIGVLKDIAAGAPTFAAIFAIIIASIIYIPKIVVLF